MLAQRLGSAGIEAPVRVLGDGHAHGIGHWLRQDPERPASMILLAVGTGIGGAFIDRCGRPLTGEHGVGGHFGHIVVAEATGLRCPCGVDGHVEAVASGAGISRAYARESGVGDIETAERVARLASTNDRARRVIDLAGRAVGHAAASLANAFDPGFVVVTGTGVKAGPQWAKAVHGAYAEALHPGARGVQLLIQDGGVERALVGVARFAANLTAEGAA